MPFLHALILGERALPVEELESQLLAMGAAVEKAHDVEAAIGLMHSWSASIAFVEDQFVDRFRQTRPETPCVVLSDHPESDRAIRAAKAGALGFLVLPMEPQRLRTALANALAQLEPQADTARKAAGIPVKRPRLIGNSPAMQDVYRLIGQIAPREITVLITGESGTGKEVVANAIVEHSARSDKPFLTINCAAIPENLLESEIFGHERGAFTGAVSRHLGKFEQAEGGTLFLDEVGDMPLATQAKFLRVLEQHSFQRVGGTRLLKADVRIIAATNQPLEQSVAEKQFRQDLYYRLKVATIHLPPLREREVDVVLLAHFFLSEFNPSLGTMVKGFDPSALSSLLSYSWPGNIRELQNVIKASLLNARGSIFRRELLPEHIRNVRQDPHSQQVPPGNDLSLPALAAEWVARLSTKPDAHGKLLRHATSQVESAVIEHALRSCGGGLSEAASLLGISRTTLRAKMHRYGIKVKKALERDGQ